MKEAYYVTYRENGEFKTPVKLMFKDWTECVTYAYRLSVTIDQEIRVSELFSMNGNGHYFHPQNAKHFLA